MQINEESNKKVNQYISAHADDFLITRKNPMKLIDMFEEYFNTRFIEEKLPHALDYNGQSQIKNL